MKKIVLLFLCFSLFSCTTVARQPSITIDENFVRLLVTANAKSLEDGIEEECRFVVSQLEALTPDELRAVNRIIKADLDSSSPRIIGLLPVDRRIVHRLQNMIDDRLGILDYDLVVTGRFKEYVASGASITYYTFVTTSGETIEVYVSVSTLMPSFGYWENYHDDVRLLIKSDRQDDIALRYVAKIELLQRNTSATNYSEPQ